MESRLDLSARTKHVHPQDGICATNEPISLIDVALLHLLVIGPSTIRLFTGSYELAPNQTESVVFFAATFSGIALLCLWFVFGTSDWRRRCTQALFAAALILGIYIALWTGNGWYLGMILPAFTAAILIGLGAVFALRIRLHHKSDTQVKPSWSGATIKLTNLMIWTCAFGVLFGVWQYSAGHQASLHDWGIGITQGAVGSALAVACLTFVLSGRWIIGTLLTAGVTAAACYPMHHYLSPKLFHPSGSFITLYVLMLAMLLLSAWPILINGYRLTTPKANAAEALP